MSTPINQIRTMSAITQPGPLNPPIYNPVPPGPIASAGSPDLMQQNPMQMDMTSMAGQQPPNQLVEDILREFEAPPGENYQQDISAAGMNYAMDPVHIPPQKNPAVMQQLQPEETHISSAGNTLQNGSNMDLSVHNLSSSASGSIFNMQYLLAKLKPLLVVFVIIFILSLHQFNRYLFSLFPQLLLENGQLSVYGILLRALIGTVVYYLAVTFI